MPKLPPEEDWITGAYAWVNLVNGKVYVGGAYKSFEQRKRLHLRELRKGTHCNGYFQAAWSKYGEEAFEFRVLERCAPERVREVEQKWLDSSGAADPEKGYNLSPTAGSNLGVKKTEDSKRKISEAASRQWADPEMRSKVRAKMKGLKRSAETRKKLAESHTGLKQSQESREKKRQALLNFRREQRVKLAEALASVVEARKKGTS